MVLNTIQGSEYTTKAANVIVDTYRNIVTTERPRVTILDKEVFENLSYSTIVLSKKNNDTVTYYTILLGATGDKPMSANEIKSELLSAVSMNRIPNIFTPDEAINDILHDEVVSGLKKEYGVGNEYISVDGLVVPYSISTEQLDVTMNVVSIIGYNALITETMLASGGIRDINIKEAKARSHDSILKIEANMHKCALTNEIGLPVRTDWTIKLNAVNIRQQQFQNKFNTRPLKTELIKSTGYVDALPAKIDVPTIPGSAPIKKIRFAPHIITTSINISKPTTGYMLLALITNLVMVQENMWMSAMTPKEGSKSNIGALNLIANLESSQNGVGESIQFNSKKVTPEKMYAYIKEMFSLPPVISVDIESFGPQTFYTSILSAAAEPTNAENDRIAAAREIINVASWLTNGEFSKDYPLNGVFNSTPIYVPTGTWVDSTGERDIRDIDLAFVSAHTNDINMINKWALSNSPREVSGMDPFTTKVDIIADLIPDAAISGKAVRVTFTANFIQTLANAATAAGLDVKYVPEVTYNKTADINVMSSYINGAGIQTTPGLFRQTGINTPQFVMGGTGMGYNRY
jgi:hypothetical protein